MPLKVVPYGAIWLTVDTQTHQVRGRHATKPKAERQRRILEQSRRRKKGK